LTGECEYALRGTDEVCRSSTGPCDVTEFCDGLSPECPTDTRVSDGQQGGCPSGSVCQSGQCVCVPTRSCADLPAKACGQIDDGCGTMLNCGGCNLFNLNQVCVNNQCVCEHGNVPCSGLDYCLNPTDSETDLCVFGFTTPVESDFCDSNSECPAGSICASSYSHPSPVCMTIIG
jgi:hypothetical protein